MRKSVKWHDFFLLKDSNKCLLEVRMRPKYKKNGT